jgi:hypothetical protein
MSTPEPQPQPTESTLPSQAAGSEPRPLSQQPAYGFWIVVIAIAVLGAAFGAALIKWGSARDVVTTMGPITGAVAALVAAYFGVRAGTYTVAAAAERDREREREEREREAQGQERETRRERGTQNKRREKDAPPGRPDSS